MIRVLVNQAYLIETANGNRHVQNCRCLRYTPNDLKKLTVDETLSVPTHKGDKTDSVKKHDEPEEIGSKMQAQEE